MRSLNSDTIAERVASQDWKRMENSLDERGWAPTRPLLTASECRDLISAYDEPDLYRSRVTMARHNFGLGEYQYYDYPLPGPVEELRNKIYALLVPIANRWSRAMGMTVRYPKTLSGFLRRCHKAGQIRPTPLILKYGENDYNCLHQDLYGELHFPLQLAILLNCPERDFSGGEFVLTEQRPRMQSRVHVVPLTQGTGVVFAVNQRPVRGIRGFYRVTMRHGVSRVVNGHRHTLGLIFHDAR